MVNGNGQSVESEMVSSCQSQSVMAGHSVNGFDAAIDFDVGEQDLVSFHALNRELRVQAVALKVEQRQKEDAKHWRYTDIVRDRKEYEWTYRYDEEQLAQWKKLESKYLSGSEQLITSTMLTLSGIDGLMPSSKDEERVRSVLVESIGFAPEHIERVQIREGRFWSIVYIRAPIKVIKDRMRNLEEKTERERRDRVRPPNYYQMTEEERRERGIPPLYSLREFNRRPRESEIDEELNSERPNAKLYVTNFDVLNRKCHKALTKLFLKFGDLKTGIFISLRFPFRRTNGHGDPKGDPFAYVEYKDSAVARTLYQYQNRNGHPKEKIRFGGRTLAIQFSKMGPL